MERILVGKGEQPVHLLARYGNRHGLVAGATGTGFGRQLLRGVLDGLLGGSRRR